MRLSAIVFGLVFMCAAFAVAVPPQDGEDVRGAFLTSRPKEKKPNTTSPRTMMVNRSKRSTSACVGCRPRLRPTAGCARASRPKTQPITTHVGMEEQEARD